MNSARKAKARPGRPKSVEKGEAILEAAGRLFFRDGLQRTSMDAVAAEAGVSKQTVYARYASKEDLLEACVRGKMTEYRLGELHAMDGVALRDALTTIGHRYLDLLMDEGVVSMFRLVIGESITSPEIARLFYETGPARTIDSLSRFMRDRIASGELSLDDPVRGAAEFLHLIKGHFELGWLLSLCDALTAKERKQHVARCVDQFLRIYAA